MTDYIICKDCECVFGGDSKAALLAGWIWKNWKWICFTCKPKE